MLQLTEPPPAEGLPDQQVLHLLSALSARVWYKDDANRILWLNEAAAASMGLPREACMGADTYALFPAMAAKYHRDDLDVIESGRPRLGIVETYGPRDGTTGWVRTDKVPTRDPATGEPRLLVVSMDVSDLKRGEESLRAANANLEAFASTASHDLRAPLRQIAMLSEIALEEVCDADGALPEMLRDVHAIAERTMDLLASLLEVARHAQVLPTLRPVRLGDVVREAGKACQRLLVETGAEVVLAGDAIAMGDPDLLEQVFRNLIENGVKYRGEAAGRIRIALAREGVDAVATVTDDGIGIPSAYRERAFEMFNRLHADTGPASGHGVGLALCRRIAVAHGGTIRAVDPELGEGARIVLRLPGTKEAAA